MYDETIDETANRSEIIEAMSTLTVGDIVRFNDRASTATVMQVNEWGDSSLNSLYLTLQADTDAETIYKLQHDYDDNGIRLRQRRGFDDDGNAIWADFTLTSLEVVDAHTFRRGNVYRKRGESSTHYLTVVGREPCDGRTTTTRRVLVHNETGDVLVNEESGRPSRLFKEDLFDGGYELVGEVRKNDEYHDADRDEVLRVAWVGSESVGLMDDSDEVVRRVKFHDFVDELGERLSDADGGDWEPEPVSLRDTKGDLDSHARRNLEQLKMAEEFDEDEDPEARSDGGETEELPLLAVRRNRRRGDLEVATRGFGFPVRQSVSEAANESFLEAMEEIRETIDLEAAEPKDELGELTVDADTREVQDFRICDQFKQEGGSA